jgi:hypothetical protein
MTRIRLLIATAAILVAVCLPHSAFAQLIIGSNAGIGRFHGATTEPGMPTCNLQVSEECRRLKELGDRNRARAARMRSNVHRGLAR